MALERFIHSFARISKFRPRYQQRTMSNANNQLLNKLRFKKVELKPVDKSRFKKVELKPVDKSRFRKVELKPFDKSRFTKVELKPVDSN